MGRLERESLRRGIVLPARATLARYGLVLDEWLALMRAQGWRCPICERSTGVRWVVDHEHVAGWKRLAPEVRKRFVRGVLCVHCNWKRVHSSIGAAEALRIARYLAAYEKRRDAA